MTPLQRRRTFRVIEGGKRRSWDSDREGLVAAGSSFHGHWGNLNMAEAAQGAVFILASAFLYGLTMFLFRDQIRTDD